jgi:hypothetical protein
VRTLSPDGAVAGFGVQEKTSMDLSFEVILIFILENGCLGRLTGGRVERRNRRQLDVYSPHAEMLNGYVSQDKLRSWCIVGLDGHAIGDWSSIAPEDAERFRCPIR